MVAYKIQKDYKFCNLFQIAIVGNNGSVVLHDFLCKQGATTLSIMTLIITSYSIMTLSIMTFSFMTEYCYADCHLC
jgi:hypothetical protein